MLLILILRQMTQKRFFILFIFIVGSLISCAQTLPHYGYEAFIPNTGYSFKMVKIPAGFFFMGSNDSGFGQADEQPVHLVFVDSFYMGATEVTYEMYDAFAHDETFSLNSAVDAITRPSPPYIDVTLGMGKSGGFPANSMQPFGALMFCKWLYEKTGTFFRLPTEAEWEYACRANTTTIYPFGNDSSDLEKYAWYAANSGGKYHKTGELLPNAFGLYDMLGNVGEWTLDQYDENFYASLGDTCFNPVKIAVGKSLRTVRGGNYSSLAKEARSAARLKADPIWNRRDPQVPKSKWWNADAPFVGFRLVQPIKQPNAGEAADFFKLYLGK